MDRWTLVRHTGFSVGGKEDFRNAVEVRNLTTSVERTAIARAGGVIYVTYPEADEAEKRYNFPDPKYKGIVPQAKGKFVQRAGFDEEIFVPDE